MERFVLKNRGNKVVILILSGKNNEDRRQAQRDTWLKNIEIPHYFVLGGPTDLKEPDILWADSKDDNLPRKLLSAYQRISNRLDFDYIFTCDDDTYVVIDRLLSCGYENYMYMGECYLFKEEVNEGIGYAEGGAGFFLSREAIERITQVPLDHELIHGPSDTAIGNLSKMYNIKLRRDHRFVQGYSTKKRHGELPTPYNDKITSHYLDPELLRKVHAQFTHKYWRKHLKTDIKIHQAKTLL
tara:strand:- start:3358 stop:4080 length:723 start_codon:yes stop_codon:yes gene_type:complete